MSHPDWWCVGLVGGDRPPSSVCERRLFGVAAGVDVVVVEEFVVAGAEQDEVVEFGRAAVLDRGEVVGFEFAGGGAAGVLAVA
jgi:hypothetical protein